MEPITWHNIQSVFTTDGGFGHLFFTLQVWSILIGSGLAMVGALAGALLKTATLREGVSMIPGACAVAGLPMLPGWLLLHFSHGPIMDFITACYFWFPFNWTVLLGIPAGLYLVCEPFLSRSRAKSASPRSAVGRD